MKTQILIALGAVAALAATANAQTKFPDGGEARFVLRAVPQVWIGALPISAGVLPMNLQSDADAKLPAYPQIAFDQKEGVTLRVLPTYRGQMFQVEAADASMGEILKKVTGAFGMRVVVAPELEEQKLARAVYRAFSPDELLDIICEFSVENWRSTTGTTFFADKPSADFFEVLAAERAHQSINQLIKDDEQSRRENSDPFVIPSGNSPKVEPQPDWQKREFNGHEFYYIPGVPPSKFYPTK